MRAYLVQHGEAHPEEVSPERELTPRGRSDVERVAALLAKGGVRVAKVYHSGKTRARQTAELFAARLAPGVTSEALAGINPNDPFESLADRLRGWSEDVLVAGHQPFMGKLVALLVAGRSEPSRCRCSSALGSRRRASSVNEAAGTAPPGRSSQRR